MSRASSVVKFPIGRVVREHRIGHILAATPEAEAIEQARRSVSQAIKTLRRQEASLNLRAARERKKETPEQHAQLVERNMRRIYARRTRTAQPKQSRSTLIRSRCSARSSLRLTPQPRATITMAAARPSR